MSESIDYQQEIAFILVSGLGWVLDFGVYGYLTGMAGWTVADANFFSAIPAVTFVFVMSTRRIFAKNSQRLSIYEKYIIYVLYQLFLIASVSWLAQGIYDVLVSETYLWIDLFFDYLPIIVKLIITPLTVSLNFFVMKILTEKM